MRGAKWVQQARLFLCLVSAHLIGFKTLPASLASPAARPPVGRCWTARQKLGLQRRRTRETRVNSPHFSWEPPARTASQALEWFPGAAGQADSPPGPLALQQFQGCFRPRPRGPRSNPSALARASRRPRTQNAGQPSCPDPKSEAFALNLFLQRASALEVKMASWASPNWDLLGPAVEVMGLQGIAEGMELALGEGAQQVAAEPKSWGHCPKGHNTKDTWKTSRFLFYPWERRQKGSQAAFTIKSWDIKNLHQSQFYCNALPLIRPFNLTRTLQIGCIWVFLDWNYPFFIDRRTIYFGLLKFGGPLKRSDGSNIYSFLPSRGHQDFWCSDQVALVYAELD